MFDDVELIGYCRFCVKQNIDVKKGLMSKKKNKLT